MRHFFQSGSTLILALIVVVLLSAIAGTAMVVVSSRLDVVSQAAAWQQSLSAAEAGVDLALAALRREAQIQFVSRDADASAAWTGWEMDKTITNPSTGLERRYHQLITTALDDPNRPVLVQIDWPSPSTVQHQKWSTAKANKTGLADTRGQLWPRIRAVGTVNLPGVTRASSQASDVRLRKIAIKWDQALNRLLGSPTLATTRPRVSRVLEVMAEPVTPYSYMLKAREKVELDYAKTNSFDSLSTDRNVPTTSAPWKTSGFRGNVGSNLSSDQINPLARGSVFGEVHTNGATMPQWESRVSEQYRTDIYRQVPSVPEPFTSSVSILGVTVPSPLGLPNPPMVIPVPLLAGVEPVHDIHVNSSLLLQKGNTLEIATDLLQLNKVTVRLVIKGDFAAEGGARVLVIPTKVKLKVYVQGNIRIDAPSIGLPLGARASDFALFGLKPDSGALSLTGERSTDTNRTISIVGPLLGTIYAPDHDIQGRLLGPLNNVRGAWVGRNIVLQANSQTMMSFDESLVSEEGIIDYVTASWTEDLYFRSQWYK